MLTYLVELPVIPVKKPVAVMVLSFKAVRASVFSGYWMEPFYVAPETSTL